MSDTPLDPASLLPAVEALPGDARLVVAYSGGPDSHALLHALAALGPRLGGRTLVAAHVDHRLHPDSGRWAAHCRAVCAGLGVPLVVHEVDARPKPGESPEAAARTARYRALAATVGAGDVLLTAHHADDQAETVLLQLLRGGGAAGLAAMPPARAFGAGRLLRPLLGHPRRALRAYAEREGLHAVADPANASPDVDRSFLRIRVLPVLGERWPGAVRALARASRHQGDLAELAAEIATGDLRTALGADGRCLSVAALATLSTARQRNLVRAWVRHLGLPPPAAVHVAQVLGELAPAAPDRDPVVRWPGAQVRRFRGALHALATGAPVTAPPPALPWRPPEPLALPLGRLRAEAASGRGLSARTCAGAALEIAFRRGGERCRLASAAHSRPLKKLLQERGVPPWERSVLPLVTHGGEIVAVADLWICAGWQAAPDEPGWLIRWDRDPGLAPG